MVFLKDSGMLANLYMLEVDKNINELVKFYCGFYMRYSDDFMVVLPNSPNSEALNVFSKVRGFIADAPRLILEPSKTQYFHYIGEKVENIGKEIDAEADDSKQFINFLGFTFDGKKIFLRKKQRASIIIGCIERQKQLRELVSTQKRENISIKQNCI